MSEHTEASIIKKLRSYFNNGYNYRIENAFIFAWDWESDFFCINRDGWSFEFEVKISRSDFFADFKKQKHKYFQNEITGEDLFTFGNKKKFIPNRFYYAVPEGLIRIDEVPYYAGLITVGQRGTQIIKRAPFIHRRKYDFRKVLCDKFYSRWIEERRINALMKNDYKYACERIGQLTKTEAK